MEYVDAVIAFSKRHDQRVRMHALIWDSPQDPQWARTLLDAALAGDAAAKADLRPFQISARSAAFTAGAK